MSKLSAKKRKEAQRSVKKRKEAQRSAKDRKGPHRTGWEIKFKVRFRHFVLFLSCDGRSMPVQFMNQ